MKRVRFQNGLWFLLAVCLLTGCGGEYAGVSENGAVSGGTVSGAAVEQKTEKSVSGHRYANTTNFYMEYSSSKDEDTKLGLLQYKLDGTKMQTLRIKDFEGLISVDEESVYYSKWKNGTGYSTICRILLEKGEEGDRKLDLENEEIIYTTKHMIADSEAEPYVYLDDQDIVYIGVVLKDESGPELTCKVMRYDREKKKEIPLKEQPECSGGYANALIMVGSYDRKLILSSLEKGLYCLDLDTEELDFIHKGKDILFSEIPDTAHIVSDGNLIYMAEEWKKGDDNAIQTLYRYSLEEKKEEVLVSETEVREAVLKQGLVQGGEETIQHIELIHYFVQGDHLYVQYQLNEDNGQGMKARYVILYKSISQNSELVCENDLTECLAANSDNRQGTAEWYDETEEIRKKCSYEQNGGRCLEMANGKAILFLVNQASKSFEFGCYDLNSGEFKKISAQDAEWYEPYYDERVPYWWRIVSEDKLQDYTYEALTGRNRDELMSWNPSGRMEVHWKED